MYRDVVEEDHFVAELDSLKKDYPRIYEAKDAVCWELARRPLIGEPIEDSPGWFVYLTTDIGALPTFRVLYRFDPEDDDHVYLQGIAPVKE